MNETAKHDRVVVGLAVLALGLCGVNASAGGLLDVDFGEVSFGTPMMVDNPYWPLNPDGAARTFTYEAETEDGCIVNKVYVNSGPPGGP